ncbi:tyrosyl-tRNA synthetase [Gloeomargarita lithophora Alchichica-D10]|uniref:Tyrosine--tRNA ligase n=1 Tax=Gloeomargarita lithophora Alchichica-D10 TaxID=1188229 RepID=A0A1J0AA96_9CYAN|nr:tyrosine--tRNA ligase [Gloeomargarita lithophora]APB32854.1 tyrosyl-tRNA synthetase [Gloeomargarita lithophora Alchichica-D10]
MSIADPVDSGLVTRGVAEVFPDQAGSSDPRQCVTRLLQTTDRPLRVKLGVDATGSHLHLGHSIPLRKLRAFQDAGHTAVLIIGDFTAQIGDPTGRTESRPPLTAQQVHIHAQTYLAQIQSILDFATPGRLEVHHNSTWLARLDLKEIINLLGTMTVGQMLAKEGFAERYGQNHPIFLHEFLYPLLQGYDSVAVQADVELGGTDQKFNIAVGRDLQRHFGQPPQFGLLVPILLGTDGVQKMSKSLDNFITMQDHPSIMYQKLQKVPDDLLPQYFELLTNLSLSDLPNNPREQQKLLAQTVTAGYYGGEAAQQAALATAGEIPEFSLQGVTMPVKLFYLLAASGLCRSSSEARRQIQSGAVRLDDQRITDVDWDWANSEPLLGRVLKLGKSKFVRLVF